jgi:hypothetical protein
MGLFIKRADIADTLGLTSVLLVDKSALLAPNQMRLTNFWLNRQLLTVDKNALKSEEKAANKRTLDEIFDTISACNRTPAACFVEPIEKSEKKKVCIIFLLSKNPLSGFAFQLHQKALSAASCSDQGFRTC